MLDKIFLLMIFVFIILHIRDLHNELNDVKEWISIITEVITPL